MPEENRVFDVAKPGHGSPQATSKPVIVGHSPTLSDPMMRNNDTPDLVTMPEPTRINVSDQADDTPKLEVISETPAETSTDTWSGQFGENSDAVSPPTPEIETVAPDSEPAPTADAVSDTKEPAETHEAPPDSSVSEEPIIGAEQLGHVEGLHVSAPKRKSPLLMILAIILVLVVGAYLFIDSNVVNTGVKLPFHVFKQKAVIVTTPPPAKPAVATVPSGFTKYSIEGTTVTFAAPTSWGTPTSSTDPGYTVRDAANKSDGIHAYLVDFATNKDVQVAVTSSKYLPALRANPQYYDFLQWCTGTNDGKVYLGTLKYTSTDKADTATTVSCDQGPITAANKLDSKTIVELKAKDSAGVVAGDLYTENISAGNIVVFRVKDKAMTNAIAIKQLLGTVKSTATTTTSGSSSSASQ
ncbi:hypothetical protein KW803_00985 [Candidatus Saccharibacteria bacterium]|nr:hypothetical protein [Candidatus Saccharibacteria bacterium]